MRVLAFLLMVFSLVAAEECKVYEGYASWYGKRFHGRKTSSGEVFNKYKYTAASRDFPLGTYLFVKNLSNGESVVVIVTDRGPYKRGRIIDLSRAAAEKLGFVKQGLAKVQVIPLSCAMKEEEVGEESHEEIIRDLLNTL
ncbi:MAG: septal ring lytic transglycosylase RlpA family protein [Aquificaceae bacterium]